MTDPAETTPPGQDPASLDEWAALVGETLGITDVAAALDISVVLDLARDAARGVARPAAPLTTFLVGYAAGARGADSRTIQELASQIGRLAESRRAQGDE